MSGKKRTHNEHDVAIDIKRTKNDQLTSAVRRGDLDTIKTVIRDGADIEQYGHKCLMMACRYDHNNIVSYLIQSGVDINKTTAENGVCAIDECVATNTLRCLKLLVDNGARLDARSNGVTPLLLACYWRNELIVEYLLGSSSCPRAAKIEALELMGAMSVKGNNFETAHGYWLKSLEVRLLAEPGDHLQPKSNAEHPVYGYQFHTMEDLGRIKTSKEDMLIQALIIMEKMKDCHRYINYDFTVYNMCEYLKTINYKKTISISIHLLDRHMQSDGDLGTRMHLTLSTIQSIFSSLYFKEPPMPYEVVMPVLSKGVEVIEFAMRPPWLFGTNCMYHHLTQLHHLCCTRLAF